MLTGFIPADPHPETAGIVIDGNNIEEKPLESKRRFSFVPDTPELFSRLKAAEYLNFIADVEAWLPFCQLPRSIRTGVSTSGAVCSGVDPAMSAAICAAAFFPMMYGFCDMVESPHPSVSRVPS